MAAALAAAPAAAWQVDDPIHTACHERITHDALHEAGYVRDPPALSAQDRSLRDSLQWDAGAYDANVYALSLVLGSRWPDAQGAADFSFYELAAVHNGLGDQGLHCLRAETQTGEDGDRQALADCRAQIERHFWLALKTLDASGSVDPESRELVDEALPFVGRTQVPVSGFYVHAGIAAHAIEDSFSHFYRSADGRRVHHVFNWSAQVRGTLQEARDGHGHEKVLDKCEDVDPGAGADPRRKHATAAVVQFLRALSQPGDRDARAAALQRFLDDWETYEPGCSFDNNYCEDPIQQWLRGAGRGQSDNYAGSGCGSTGALPLIFAPALVLAVLALRRRRIRAAVLAAALALVPAPARADEPDPTGMRYEARVSMSVQNPAYAAGVAARYQTKRFDAGLFLELNPWYSVERRMTILGTTNAGVGVHYLHRLRPDLWYRVGLAAGVSILNQEWYGTNAGNSGPFANLTLLGLVWQFADSTALTVDAFDLALPVPQMTGWPMLYAQHRFSVGLQFAR